MISIIKNIAKVVRLGSSAFVASEETMLSFQRLNAGRVVKIHSVANAAFSAAADALSKISDAAKDESSTPEKRLEEISKVAGENAVLLAAMSRVEMELYKPYEEKK